MIMLINSFQGNATKYSVFFYAPRDVNYSIIGEILIQCANPVECSNVFRLLRKNFEPPITVVKDKGQSNIQHYFIIRLIRIKTGKT